ncbi:MAG: tetratricopeptide repeat protein [Cytophagaceae bacterium]
MKLLWIFLHIFSSFLFWINKADISNDLKKEAAQLYADKRYPEAVQKFTELSKIYPQDQLIQLNLAHALYKSYQFTEASTVYSELIINADPIIRSTAQHQMGCILYRSKKYQQALFYFKEALLSNPNNIQASHNFELVRLHLHQEEKSNSSSSGKGKGKNSDSSQPDVNNNFQDNGDQQTDMLNRKYYHRHAVSSSRAEKILQHLEEQEIQYLQQLNRRVRPAPNQSQW